MNKRLAARQALAQTISVENISDVEIEQALMDNPEAPDVTVSEVETNETGELDQLHDRTEQLCQTYISLEGIQERIQGSLSKGGLSYYGRHFALLSISEAALEGYSLEYANDVPSLESFNVSMEETSKLLKALKWLLKTIWDALVDAIKELYDIGKRTYEKYFSYTARLARRANKLGKRLRDVEGRSPAKEELSLKGEMQALSLNGVLPEKIAPHLTDFNKHVEAVLIHYVNESYLFASRISDFMASVNFSDAGQFVGTSQAVRQLSAPELFTVEQDEAVSEDHGYEYYRTPLFLGDKTIHLKKVSDRHLARQADTYPDGVGRSVAKIRDDLQAQRHYLRSHRTATSLGDMTKTMTPQSSDLQSILSAVLTGCNYFVDYQKDYKRRNSLVKQLEKAGEDYRKLASAMTIPEGRDGYVTLAGAVLTLPETAIKYLDRPVADFYAHALKVYVTALDLVEQALDEYGV